MFLGKRGLSVLVGMVMMFWAGAVAALPDLFKTAVSLKGVDGLYVKVSNLDPDLKDILSKKSISEDILISEIERKLESAGIKAAPEDQFRKTGKENCLFLKIEIADIELKNEYVTITDGTRLPKTKFLYRLRLEFYQEVALGRNNDIKTMAITWMKDDFGYRRLGVIRDAAMSLADTFVQAFLSANGTG